MTNNYMKLVGLAILGLASTGFSQTTFDYTGTIDTYTVPAGVTSISIQAYGAQGGNTNGGLGAGIYGEFDVTPGQELNIVVGQQGVVNGCGGAGASGGGGGGTFIWDPTEATLPLVAAGAGGGGNQNFAGDCTDGLPGLTGEDGSSGAEGEAAGGVGGNGGAGDAPSGTGAGGGGWLTAGQNSTWGGGDPSIGGTTIPSFEGGAGSSTFGPGGEGGFGGGGGAVCGCGGGAGYSGGAGGNGNTCRAGGGGGGSYNGGVEQNNEEGIRSGNGEVIITELCNSIVVSVTTIDEMLGSDGEIDITVTGGDGTYVFDWDTDGTGDFDDSEDLTGLTAGTYIVEVDDETDCANTTETIVVNSQVGIAEDELEATVYPNPTSDFVQVAVAGEFNYLLSTIDGKTLFTGKAVNKATIDFSNLSVGTYLLKVEHANTAKVITVVKQ